MLFPNIYERKLNRKIEVLTVALLNKGILTLDELTKAEKTIMEIYDKEHQTMGGRNKNE